MFTIGNKTTTWESRMPAPNTQFDLSVDDLDLIEEALREAKASRLARQGHGDARAIHDLLGRLHNQKVFYRPKQGYLGG